MSTSIPKFYLTAKWKRLRSTVLTRDGGLCMYCGGKAVTADHIIPRSAGGPDVTGNLISCCWRCNELVGGRIFPEYYSKRRWIRAQLNLPLDIDDCDLSPETWEAILAVGQKITPKRKARRRRR